MRNNLTNMSMKILNTRTIKSTFDIRQCEFWDKLNITLTVMSKNPNHTKMEK